MTVFIPKGRSTYYVKFRFRGKQYFLSTGVTEKAAAQKNARDLYSATIGEHFRPLDQVQIRSNIATIGEILTHYMANVKIRYNTARNNASYLRQLVREVLELPDEKDNARVDQVSTSVLNSEFVIKFQNLRLKSCNRDAFKERQAATTINSAVRQAQNIFSTRLTKRNFYKDFKLPDLKSFLSAPRLEEKTRSYSPLSEASMQAMTVAANELREKNPPLYLINQLFIRCGLRNIEIWNAKHSWIEIHDGVAYFRLIHRADFQPKGSEGMVAIPSDLFQDLQKNKAPNKPPEEDFLIPAANKTERHKLIYREHSKWVRQFIPDRSKSSYELRKQAGSIIATREGNLMAAQAFLRHSSPVTTSKYYATLLKPIAPIQVSEVSSLK